MKSSALRAGLRAGVCAAALLLAGGIAQAAPPTGPVQYRWRDTQGDLHFSDTLSAAAIARGYDVVNAQGIVVQHVPSPQEKRAEEAAAAAQARLEAAQRLRQARDQQMLAAYPDEAAYDKALHAQAQSIEDATRSTRINLQSQEGSLADLLQRAGEIEHAKKPVPPFLKNDIAKQRAVVEQQRALLAQQQQQHRAALDAIPAALAHYRAVQQQMQAQQDGQLPP